MTDLSADTIGHFLEALASGAPAPGGGAAAALAGAMAAALVAMVCRVSAAREREASGIAEHVAPADALRVRLTDLAGEDMRAYAAVLAARRAGGPVAAVDRALARASEIPLLVAGASREVLGLCAAAAPSTRASAISDLAVAAALAWGALESAAVTARTNLAEIRDPELAGPPAHALDRLVVEAQEARRRVGAVVETRTGVRR